MPDSNSLQTVATAKPLVSIVVVNFNCEKWLPGFFDALLGQSLIGQCEVLFVDNCSKDRSVQLCREALPRFPNARMVESSVNLGFGEGCNLGASHASADFLYFVNSDCWFEKDCIRILYEAALQAPPDHAIFSAVEYGFDGHDPTIGSHSRGSSGFDLFGCQVKSHRQQDLFTVGTFFFIRRSAFEKAGRFDTRFFVYGEEQDLSWRIVLAGQKIRLVDKAVIHHQATTSTNAEGVTTEFRRFYANRNQLMMILINSSSVLCLMSVSYTILILIEALAGAVLARKLSFIHTSVVKPWLSCIALRGHILERRRFLRTIRRHGDGWMISHFFRLGFGHWDDIRRFLNFNVKIK